ncbi:MAG: hypothetical protein ACKVOQ_18440 [Cyclobacteriaceae bacterium]
MEIIYLFTTVVPKILIQFYAKSNLSKTPLPANGRYRSMMGKFYLGGLPREAQWHRAIHCKSSGVRGEAPSGLSVPIPGRAFHL